MEAVAGTGSGKGAGAGTGAGMWEGAGMGARADPYLLVGRLTGLAVALISAVGIVCTGVIDRISCSAVDDLPLLLSSGDISRDHR